MSQRSGWKLALQALVLGLFLLYPCQAAEQEMALYANGVRVSAPCFVRDGIAYVPPQALASALGLNVQWNAEQNRVTLNGVRVEATPLVEQGRVYLPVEALARAAGTTVEWDGANSRILITTAGGNPTVSVRPSPAPQPAYTPPPPDPYAPGAAPREPVTARGTDPNVVSDPSWIAPGAVPSVAQNLPPNMRAPIMDMTLPGPTTAPMNGEYVSNGGGASMAPVQARSTGDIFVPRSGQNSIFQVTVTNLQSVGTMKEYYKPRSGHKFVIVYLSQQNISNEVQIYTGKFNLQDQSGNTYNGLDNLSNFWLVVLRPQGINFGYLVFEMPLEASPASLTLSTVNQPPLTLQLQ